MTLMLEVWAVAGLLEFVIWLIPLRWRWPRLIIILIALILLCAASSALAFYYRNVFSWLIASLSLYRGFNLLRAMKARLHPLHLRRVSLRSSGRLITAQLLIGLAWLAWTHGGLQQPALWTGLAGLEFVGVAVLALATRHHVRRAAAAISVTSYTDKQLPSVTIAVPARNETDELQDCLESILTSDYPKLEILVLDDCSQSARTPEIIRSYAHSGVRFIRGHEPPPHWLAKNQAYAHLSEEASGAVILFCGVDVRLQPSSVRRLISYLLAKDKAMLSVLPRSSLEASIPLLQPVRYGWELALPRRLFKRPPVLSSCWLIKKGALDRLGGFAAVSRMIVPEASFAKRLIGSDSYSFIASATAYGVSSRKTAAEQRATAVRTRYPQLHRRPEIVWLVGAGELALVLLPPGLLLAACLLPGYLPAAMLALLDGLALLAIYRAILRLSYGQARLLHIAALPLALLADVAMLNYSMEKYEFSDVIWKGRNVCLPVMHVTSQLPKI